MGEGDAAAPRRKGRGRARHLSRPKRDDTDDPRRARQRALRVLFQADLRGVSPSEVLDVVASDDDARAMLDAVDELSAAEAREPVEVPSSVPSDAAAPAGATRIDESEAQRIWREEADRAARVASGRDVAQAEVEPSGEDEGSDGTEAVPAIDGFTRLLVLGVDEHRAEIDELIARYARRWSISRMPVVDRTVLRLATFELLHEDTAPPVVINEAVELVKALSTDDSGRYVNGVLESIRKDIAARADAQVGSVDSGAPTTGELDPAANELEPHDDGLEPKAGARTEAREAEASQDG